MPSGTINPQAAGEVSTVNDLINYNLVDSSYAAQVDFDGDAEFALGDKLNLANRDISEGDTVTFSAALSSDNSQSLSAAIAFYDGTDTLIGTVESGVAATGSRGYVTATVPAGAVTVAGGAYNNDFATGTGTANQHYELGHLYLGSSEADYVAPTPQIEAPNTLSANAAGAIATPNTLSPQPAQDIPNLESTGV